MSAKIVGEKGFNFFQDQSKGLHYAMEGYIQNFKIYTEGNRLKFSWNSGMPHSLIHITHFFLSRCGLGKGWNIPHSAASWDTDCPCTPSTLFDHVSFFLHEQDKSTIKLLYYASSLLFSMELSELMSQDSLGWNVIVSSAF